jgi:hypothetical protein
VTISDPGPSPSEVVERVPAALALPTFALLPSERTLPRVAAAAGLAHLCGLLEAMVRESRSNAVAMELLARAQAEATAVTLYLVYDGQSALSYLKGASLKTLQTMQRELDDHDARVRAERDRIAALNLKREEQNRGIEARNQREDSAIALRPEASVPVGVTFDVDFRAGISELERDQVAPVDFSYREVPARLLTVTRDHEAGEIDLFRYYSLGYRGLSMSAAHPTSNALGRYVDQQGAFMKIKPVPDPFEDEGVLRFAVISGLIVAERVLEVFGADASWFSDGLRDAFAAAEQSGQTASA